MLKRCAVVLALFVLALSPLMRAQEDAAPVGDPTQVIPETQRASSEDVARLFTAMRLRKNMEMVIQTMRAQMKGMSQRMMSEKLATLTPEQQKKIQDAMAVSMEESISLMRMEDMLSDMIPVYQKYLSKEDLDGIISFYSSPVGQRLLDKTPAMTSEAMKITMDRMQKMMPQIMSNMEKRMHEVMNEIGSSESEPPKKTPASKS